MKKIFFYLISLLNIACMLLGFFLKKVNLMSFGFYLHFFDDTYVSLDEYKTSKKIVFNTIFHPSCLLVLTVVVIYQTVLG